MSTITAEDVVRRVHRAVDALIRADSFLFIANANERSLTHRLAVYLEHEFPGFNVDCEYNRHYSQVKSISVPQESYVKPDDLNATTIFPDVVVHHRNSDEDNLLIIEAKKSTGRADDWDREKLNEYLAQLHSDVAMFVVFCTGSPVPTCKVERIRPSHSASGNMRRHP